MAAHPRVRVSIAERGIVRVVIGMRDPHPRVNGAGTLILRNADVEVIEGVCEPEVRRQLGPWVLEQHPTSCFAAPSRARARNDSLGWLKSTESTALE